MSLRKWYQRTRINLALTTCAAFTLALGILLPVREPSILSMTAAKAQPLGSSELSVSDLNRDHLLDLIEEFDSKINDINAKNPEMAKINAESFSGGHMNPQSGEMEDKFGRVTPSNTVRNGLLGSATNALLMTALLSNLLRNQQNDQPSDPGANPAATPSALPTPHQTLTPTPTATPSPTPR